MIDSHRVFQYLEQKLDNFISDTMIRTNDNTIVLYIELDKISEKSEHGYISKIQLENFRKNVAEHFSTNVEIITTNSEKLENNAEVIKKFIISKHEKIIKNIAVRFLNAKKIDISIQTNYDDKTQVDQIIDDLKSITESFNVTNQIINWNEDERSLPTLIELLILTKTIQPANIDDYLNSQNNKIKQTEKIWLNKQLDKLIKKKLIVRDNTNKKYSVTSKGLGVIPNNFSRNNSDIKRALDLGKRKW